MFPAARISRSRWTAASARGRAGARHHVHAPDRRDLCGPRLPFHFHPRRAPAASPSSSSSRRPPNGVVKRSPRRPLAAVSCLTLPGPREGRRKMSCSTCCCGAVSSVPVVLARPRVSALSPGRPPPSVLLLAVSFLRARRGYVSFSAC